MKNVTLFYADFETETCTIKWLSENKDKFKGNRDVTMYLKIYKNQPELEITFVSWGGVTFGKQSYPTLFKGVSGFLKCFSPTRNYQGYFHNLKFDGSFIESYLLHLGYQCDNFSFDETDNESSYCKLHTDLMGLVYAMRIGKITIFDSYKMLPFSLADAGKMVGLTQKGDYDFDNHICGEYSTEFFEYLRRDVLTLKDVIEWLHNQGNTSMTLAGSAWKKYLELNGYQNNDDYQKDFSNDGLLLLLKQFYQGGNCYVNPNYVGKLVRIKGFDENSEYPSIPERYPLPKGKPITHFNTKKEFQNVTKNKKLWQCKMVVTLKWRGGDCIPPLKVGIWNPKVSGRREYTRNATQVTICVNSPEWDYINRVYKVTIHSITNLFSYEEGGEQSLLKYISYFKEMKLKAEQEGNGPLRTYAKLMLNALTGKFGQDRNGSCRRGYLDENGVVKNTKVTNEYDEGLYVPMVSFITAYARNDLNTAWETDPENGVYTDTDSIKGTLEANFKMVIHDSDFGAWKQEHWDDEAVFLCAKTYVYKNEKGYHIKGAGMGKKVKDKIKRRLEKGGFQVFRMGTKFINCSFKQKVIVGGTKLTKSSFVIRAR